VKGSSKQTIPGTKPKTKLNNARNWTRSGMKNKQKSSAGLTNPEIHSSSERQRVNS